ncbi:MAG: hypothetical protein ACTSRP_11160 [Candidatus Helarchaeota archaeon]
MYKVLKSRKGKCSFILFLMIASSTLLFLIPNVPASTLEEPNQINQGNYLIITPVRGFYQNKGDQIHMLNSTYRNIFLEFDISINNSYTISWDDISFYGDNFAIKTYYSYGKNISSSVYDVKYFNPKDHLIGMTCKIIINIEIGAVYAEDLGRIPFEIYIYYAVEGRYYEQKEDLEFIVLDENILPVAVDFHSLFFENYDVYNPNSYDKSLNYYIHDTFGKTRINIFTHKAANITFNFLKISIQSLMFEKSIDVREDDNELIVDINDFDCFDTLEHASSFKMRVELTYQIGNEFKLADYENNIYVFIYDNNFIRVEPFIVDLSFNVNHIFTLTDRKFAFDIVMLPLIINDPNFDYYYSLDQLAIDIKIDSVIVFKNYIQKGGYIEITSKVRNHNEFYIDFTQFSFRESSYEKDVTFNLKDIKNQFIIRSTQNIKIVVINKAEGVKIFNLQVPQRGYFTPNDTLCFYIYKNENYELSYGTVELFDKYISLVDRYKFTPREGFNKIYDVFKDVKKNVIDYLRIKVYAINILTNKSISASFKHKIAFFSEGEPISIEFIKPNSQNCFFGPSLDTHPYVRNFEFKIKFNDVFQGLNPSNFGFLTSGCYLKLQNNKYYYEIDYNKISNLEYTVQIPLIYEYLDDESNVKYLISADITIENINLKASKTGYTNIQKFNDDLFGFDVDLSSIKKFYMDNFNFNFTIIPKISSQSKSFKIFNLNCTAFLKFMEGSTIKKELDNKLLLYGNNYNYNISFSPADVISGYAEFEIFLEYRIPSGARKTAYYYKDIYCLSKKFPLTADKGPNFKEFINYENIDLDQFHDDVNFKIYSLSNNLSNNLDKFQIFFKIINDNYNRIFTLKSSYLKISNASELEDYEGMKVFGLMTSVLKEGL